MKQKIDTYKDYRGVVRFERDLKEGDIFWTTPEHIEVVYRMGEQKAIVQYQRGHKPKVVAVSVKKI